MKKKVIFRSGSLRMGGLERILIEVLQNIDKKKYEIILVIDDDCGKENIFEKDIPKDIKYYFLKPEKLIRKTEYHKLNKKKIYHKLMYNFYMFLENKTILKNMKKLMNDLKNIDVIIDFDAGASKYIEKLDINKKIVWIHNSIPKLKKKKSKIKRFGKRLEKYDKIVAICDDMKNELQNLYPNIKNKITRIYNPFNFKRISELSINAQELSLEQKEMLKENYIISIARLDNVQKDFKTLLKAMKILKDKGINEKLYIVGDGPSRKEIEKEIECLGIEDIVCLIGSTKNPYIWLKNSDFFVHSSKYEGLPTVLIEALICDKMIISSDCPTGPKEILENESCGKLFEIGDYEKLAILLENYIVNEEKVKEFYPNIMRRRNDFNQEKIIMDYEKLIDE
ncbi:glycosyltransferase [Fusobacterium sp. SB021]|uniref:glycosyltransferase n=1 Tax=Fusobacterium sp. SB021 TaxID=2744227 RepID=UPI003CF7EDCE